jgi:hypothetical protein
MHEVMHYLTHMSLADTISWVVGPLASFSMHHVGKHRRWAWGTTFCVQIGMFIIGILAGLHGLIIQAVWNSPVAAKNWWRWGTQKREAKRALKREDHRGQIENLMEVVRDG